MAKLISKEEYGTVDIFGVEFEAPRWWWVAVDSNGIVCAYEELPHIAGGCWIPDLRQFLGSFVGIGKIQLEPNEDWRESLTEVV